MTRVADEHPESEFQRQAKKLLNRRLAATSTETRRALEIELGAFLAAHRVGHARDVTRDAVAVEQAADVSRDTSRDRGCHGDAMPQSAVRDWKLAQAGPESD